MFSSYFSSNNCGNHNRFLRLLLSQRFSLNEVERNARGVTQIQRPYITKLVDEYLEEYYGGNLLTFHSDSLVEEIENFEREVNDRTQPPAVLPPQDSMGANFVPPSSRLLSVLSDRSIRKNPVSSPVYPRYWKFSSPKSSGSSRFRVIRNSFPASSDFKPVKCTVEDLKGPWDLPGSLEPDVDEEVLSPSRDEEGAPDSSKNEIVNKKNDEKGGGLSTPQTSKHNLEGPSSEDSKIGTSSGMDERPGSLELDTIINETEVGEQDMEMLKSGSLQIGSCLKQEEVTKKIHQTQLNENSPHRKRATETGEAEASAADSVKGVKGNFPQKSENTPRDRDGTPSEILDGYRFDESNPMTGIEDPFERGMAYLMYGCYARAAMCLEVAVRDKRLVPEDFWSEAWSCLGLCHVLTERNALAIPALKEYLKENPNDLDCLMILTISYAYEKCNNLAIITLWKWLTENPSYADLAKISPPEDMNDASSPMNLDFHQKLLKIFLKAANRIPFGKIDGGVQFALAFLHNMINDYAKSSDCFKAALLVDSFDETIWNLLGEALTNNRKYDESIEAYTNALNLRPKYTRARYNLGVSYSKMGNNMEAMNHYLMALNIRAKYPKELACRLDDSMWRSVKMAVKCLGRFDLEEAADKRDLGFLNKEFWGENPLVGEESVGF